MLVGGLLLGVYGYGIFFIGLFALLYPGVIIVWTLIMVIVSFWIWKLYPHHFSFSIPKDLLSKIILILLCMLAGVNIIGVLGPETSFDALWYQLTFPKLYIEQHAISYIPGGLLYYSTMPKFGSLLYTPLLILGNEIWVKAAQYFFGLLTVLVLYKISRKYVSITLSLLVCLIFYSNIVVAWESTVAYIDLLRAFFEILGLSAFLEWYRTKKDWLLYASASMVGLAISTKVLALGTIGIFLILLLYVFLQDKKRSIQITIKRISTFIVISLLIPLPWFLFSYVHTKSFFYPFFTSDDPVKSAYSPTILFSFWEKLPHMFLFADDPISPIYLIMLPVMFFFIVKLKDARRLVALYCISAFFLWYITPNIGGGRFILPYLPAFSLFTVFIIERIQFQKVIYITILVSVFFIACVTIVYRGIANSKYFPVILGMQTKDQFLTNRLNFSFGDFYDTDGYFKKNIKPTDTVLLFGFHNLYYVTFPFIHESWVKRGDKFTHIATQKMSLPKRFSDWELIYENPKTFVKLYKKGTRSWIY